MSEVIIVFAKPLLDAAKGHESKKKAVGLAIVCWNLSLLPKHEQQKEREKVLHTLCKENAEVINDVAKMHVAEKI